MARFTSINDSLALEDWHGELVFAFGAVDIDERIPKDRVTRIRSSKFVNPEKLCDSMDDELWEDGILMVSSRPEVGDDDTSMLQLQMYLLVKAYHVVFNAMMPYTPSPVVGELLGGLKDPSRSINQLRNMPLLLRYPLADKLAARNIGLPVLILMPGPSANELKGKLEELAERCVVICIGRSLRLCLEEGVHPDFVVQYDTHLEQKHFYDGIPPLPNTVLVALSSSNVADIARKFRGMFFRGSFRRDFLPNPYIMREGLEGSLLACMGLAEVLAAPQVYLAGNDLSWPVTTNQYADKANGEDTPAKDHADAAPDWRLADLDVVKRHYLLPNRKGSPVAATIGYIATASKAAIFAKEIYQTTGATFHPLGDANILFGKHFTTRTADDLLEHPPLDRTALLAEVDKALGAGEYVEHRAAYTYFKKQRQFLEFQAHNFKLRQLDASFDFMLRTDIIALLKNFRSFSLHFNASDQDGYRLTTAWAEAYGIAEKAALAHFLASKGAPLPVLCLAEEEESLPSRYHDFFPKEHLAPLPVTNAFTPSEAAPPHAVSNNDVAALIEQHNLVLVTPALIERYNYLISLSDTDKILFLPTRHG